MGKTTFGLRYLLHARDVTRRFVFDVDGEYSQRLKLPPLLSALDLETGIRQGWCLFDPSALFAGDTQEALKFFRDLALSFSSALPGRKIFLVDEVGRHCSPHSIPAELAAVVKTGRKVKLESVFLSQEPRQLNETLLAESTEVVSFRVAGLNSLGKLEDYFPTFPVETLPTLPPGQFAALNTQSQGLLQGRVF